jgi:hypothetical protein
MNIAVINQSTKINDADAQTMTAAVNEQISSHFAPRWPIAPSAIAFFPTGDQPPAGAWSLVLLDDTDQAGDLGYHSADPSGNPYGRVFANPVLQEGGGILDGGSIGVSVASVLSHEALETLADFDANDWSQASDGTLWAREVADPVEAWGYPITVGATTVLVSDFVTPAFFDPGAAGPYDYLKRLTAGFTIGQACYAIEMTGGQVQQVRGDDYPAWRIETKEFPAARTARRMKPPANRVGS